MLIPIAEELSLPIAMKLGAHRGVNPSLCTGGVRAYHTIHVFIVSYVEQKSKKETPARERRFPPSFSPFTAPHQTGTHQHSNDNTKTQDGVVAADVGDLRRLCAAYPKVQNYMICIYNI